MATAAANSLHALCSPRARANPELVNGAGIPLRSFIHGSNPLFAASSGLPVAPLRKKSIRRCISASASSNDFEHIPNQFREENLKDGLMDNYKNTPSCLYGLTASQMDMFMTEDNPFRRQANQVTEESISSTRNYVDNGGMYSLSGTNNGPSKYSMSVSMYRGGARGYGRPRTAPPDLPSLLLDARICYLGMPIVPAVTELIVAQLMWLDYDNPSKPIYLYINSSGTQNEKMETVGSETEAYAIADTLAYCKSKIYTVNCGMAYGQAAMLLSLGAKGYPISAKVNKSSGSVIDMWIKAKELDANTDYYIELLSKGIGKSKEEIAKDIQRPKYFQSQEAIAYGIADKIIDSRDAAFEKRNYDEILAQSRAMRRQAGGGTQAAPSGFR
ncbi:hypothetical protein J5N97_013375 [Dioscorea zingiberensis]|uniref:ATP-dependent Clp protease proteolytic subunit n=1 Tax=Dioscorea zingiberensis TaxID=325984 RepID=A0A9D5CQF7_9LILI|nr:hypothetical protein J5N97_013375 [Dioscorea zingiberensis]